MNLGGGGEAEAPVAFCGSAIVKHKNHNNETAAAEEEGGTGRNILRGGKRTAGRK